MKLITTPTEDFLYNYDAMGNITQVYKDAALSESYTYDGLNQLTAATVNGKNYTYTYDAGGNILTANEDGTSHTYTYGNYRWADQLTAYDGQTITYDAIGNPLTYRDGMSFTWKNGRQLASSTKGGTTTTYTYNADGGRKTRTVGNKTYNYYYIGGVLYAMTVNNYTLYFMYDDTGRPYGFKFNIDTGSSMLSYTLYYKYNLQGDVVGIYNTAGTEMLWYTYDPWGKLLSADGPMSSVLGGLNPFLYRGYVYDYETGFYYCNSRYYDPEIGRWINADSYVSTGQGVLGYNMYAYCSNNPVILTDSSGTRPMLGTSPERETKEERRKSFDYMNNRSPSSSVNHEKEQLKSNPASLTNKDDNKETYANESDASVIARMLYGEDHNAIEAHMWVLENRRIAGGYGGDDFRSLILANNQFSCMTASRALDPASKFGEYGEAIAWDACVDIAFAYIEKGITAIPKPSLTFEYTYTHSYSDSIASSFPNGMKIGNTWFYSK